MSWTPVQTNSFQLPTYLVDIDIFVPAWPGLGPSVLLPRLVTYYSCSPPPFFPPLDVASVSQSRKRRKTNKTTVSQYFNKSSPSPAQRCLSIYLKYFKVWSPEELLLAVFCKCAMKNLGEVRYESWHTVRRVSNIVRALAALFILKL